MRIDQYSITKEYILERITYDYVNGKLFWKKTHTNVKKGQECGCVNSHGYRNVRIGKYAYLTHRIVWFLENGYWPEMLDHINGEKLDNRIQNIRESSFRENGANKKIHRERKFYGSFRKDTKKWGARIRTNGVYKSLGCFLTKEDADAAYRKAYSQVTGKRSHEI